MVLLWKGVCRIYFTGFEDAPLFWSVDNGDRGTKIKCQRVVMAGSFETVVVPEQQAQPRAWLSFKRANVYKQNDGVVVVIDWTPAALRNRELHGAFAGEL
ncbi:hypothetical protein [Tunturiibacter gelidiferens]|uniref:hypothetical protein n=1 Tax=Tunturiibacter gelidiferens TaxID=3069689 RepID=UPI003D9ADD03